MESPDLLTDDLQFSGRAQSYLSEAARWGKFLAILGFILCGITVVLSFFIPVFFAQVPPYNTVPSPLTPGIKVAITIIYLLLALLFFFPCFYLYKFSVKMQSAVKAVSQENLDESLMNLKSLFKFHGIFTIIVLSFYALAFIVLVVNAAMQ